MNKVIAIVWIIAMLTIAGCSKGSPIVPGLKPLCDAIGVGCW